MSARARSVVTWGIAKTPPIWALAGLLIDACKRDRAVSVFPARLHHWASVTILISPPGTWEHYALGMTEVRQLIGQILVRGSTTDQKVMESIGNLTDRLHNSYDVARLDPGYGVHYALHCLAQ
jgi:hypothetical protein